MLRTSKNELLSEFGFTQDPFKKLFLESSDHKRISKAVTMAVKAKDMIAVIGERGIGKSNAVKKVLGRLKDTQIVCPYSNDITRLLISDIETSLILDLSSEKPKRGREIRARQLRRILGEASRRYNIVLVIEEAHHLHSMTLRSLKRLREMEWMGERELFTVILVGQSDPMNKPGVSEVRLRADSIHMHGLSQQESMTFISKTVGSVIDSKVLEAISEIAGSHNYEDLKAILFQLLENTFFAGRSQVVAADLMDTYGSNGANIGEQATKGLVQGKKSQLNGFLMQYQDGEAIAKKQAANGH